MLNKTRQELSALVEDYATYGVVGVIFSTCYAAYITTKGQGLTVKLLIALQLIGGCMGLLAGAICVVLQWDQYAIILAAVSGCVGPNIVGILVGVTGSKTKAALEDVVARKINKEKQKDD